MDRLLSKQEAKDGCGAGNGAICCRFLLMGPDGFCCGQFGEFHNHLLGRNDMVASRLPLEEYPLCQLKPEASNGVS